MASREAIAIREETAIGRLTVAAEALAAQLGSSVPPIEINERDPRARTGALAEAVADIIEGFLIIKPSSGAKEEKAKDGNDNPSGSGSDPEQSLDQPITRSATKRK